MLMLSLSQVSPSACQRWPRQIKPTLRTPRISAAQAIVDSAFPMSSSWCHRFDASIPAKLQEFLTKINFNDDDVHRTAPLSQTNYDPQRSWREGRAIP